LDYQQTIGLHSYKNLYEKMLTDLSNDFNDAKINEVYYYKKKEYYLKKIISINDELTGSS